MGKKMIKFYSASDFSCSFNLIEAQNIIENFNDDLSYEDINQIIQFYNIQCFFDAGVYLIDWSEKTKQEYLNKVNSFKKHIGICFSRINESNIEDIISKINIEYLEDYWYLFNKYKVYKRISNHFFGKILLNTQVRLTDILQQKEIVKYYDEEIRKYILQNEIYGKLLVKQYIEFRDKNNKMYNFPKSLTIEDKEILLEKYIISEIASPNYLKLIFESQSSSDLCLSNRLKLKAKRRYSYEIEEMSKNGVSFSYGAKVSFIENQDEEEKFEILNRDICVSYSLQWIKENRNYSTLLNNFIYLFKFTDSQFRCQHVNKITNMGILERTLGIKGRKEYSTGVVFNQIQCLAMMQTIGYYEVLKKFDIRIESILEWFFNEYLELEFGVKGFYLNLPSENSTYLEKCRTIACEIDSVLKQFKLFVEEREIDTELLQLSSEHMFINDIPSLLDKKYVYLSGKEYKIASHYLFSNQSNLNYIEEMQKEYDTFYMLIEKECVKRSNFKNYQLSEIDWLIKNDYLYLDEEERLRGNKNKVWILKEFYYNDVICSNYIGEFNESIKELEMRGSVQYGDSLFSKPEQDYFNYLLNKAEFSNGLDLRNRYVHGTQPIDKNIHKQDYYTFLRILILIVIKINEEFCLA